MNGDKPVVTIIVADTGDEAGGEADRVALLERSTASVRGQSLRGVELLVADRASLPDTLLQQAAGEFVMVLRAGDVLDRHAARTAVAMARDTAADLVSAGSRYPRTRHYQSLADRPDLLRDDEIGSKLLRTGFVRRCGLQLAAAGPAALLGFLLEAYVQARGITVLPQQLCRSRSARLVTDPVELVDVYRRVDRTYAEHANVDVVTAERLRFLEIDLPRSLLRLAPQDGPQTVQLLEPLRDYLASLGGDAVSRAPRLVQLLVFLLGQADVDGARSVVDYLERGRRLTAPLVEQDGRIFWTPRHLDTDPGRALQDVTVLGLHELPLPALQPGSSVEALETHGATATLRGFTVNPLGRIDNNDLRIAVQIGPADSAERSVHPARLLAAADDRLSWEGTLRLPSAVRVGRHGHREWVVELALIAGDQRIVVPLSAAADVGPLPRRLLRRARWSVVGNTLYVAASPRGDLVLRLVSEGPTAERVARVGSRLLSDRSAEGGPAGRSKASFGSAGSLRTKARVLRFVLSRLPMDARSVVFESHMGLSYSDNPRYISEELQRRDAGFEVIWSFAGAAPPMPAGVRTVRRASWRHVLALARARYWVDNQGLPQAIRKPARVTYLQTWHGSALKRMGEDTPGFRRLSPEVQQRHRQAVGRWDYFLARSEHDVRTLVPAFHVQAQVLRTGYPRNDPLVALRSAQQRAAVRAELGLPLDKTLVLYAPTFRETYASGLQEFELPIDLDAFFDQLPDHRLLVRTHYLQRLSAAAATHVAVRDVSEEPDITPLLVAADVLVTDYSSVMFDFANTGRPMVFYVYDYDDYAHSERGVYFSLADQAPGPMARTSEELIHTLRTTEQWQPDYEERYHAFVQQFGEYDTGSAARQVVDTVFLGAGRGH